MATSSVPGLRSIGLMRWPGRRDCKLSRVSDDTGESRDEGVGSEQIPRRPSVVLYPAEMLLLVAVPITVLLYQIEGIALRSPWYLYQRKVAFGVVTYALGLCISVFLTRLEHIRQTQQDGQRRTWTVTLVAFRERFFSPSAWRLHLRLVHSISFMFVIYINLKHLIPYVNSAVYDRYFAAVEQWLLSGVSPTTFLINLLGTDAAVPLSHGYTLFYPYSAFLTVCLILQRDPELAQRFCFAFIALWFSAIFLEYGLPTWGPCFSSPELVSMLPETEVKVIQEELWRQKLYLDRFPTSDVGVFLISGLPSLHLAVALLGSLYLQRIHPFLGLLSWLFVAVTCVTTIYFGWHFVVDLIGAVVLTFLVHALAGVVVGRSRRYAG